MGLRLVYCNYSRVGGHQLILFSKPHNPTNIVMGSVRGSPPLHRETSHITIDLLFATFGLFIENSINTC